MTDIGWYGSAYLLTNCSFQLSFGKLYSFYSVKGVFLVSIGLFEIGSAICGAAPNSVAFIVGRAIAGLGSAGIFSGGVSFFMAEGEFRRCGRKADQRIRSRSLLSYMPFLFTSARFTKACSGRFLGSLPS